MITALKLINDIIFVGQCKRGWTKDFFGPTAFVGNGLLLKNRKDLFTVDNPK